MLSHNVKITLFTDVLSLVVNTYLHTFMAHIVVSGLKLYSTFLAITTPQSSLYHNKGLSIHHNSCLHLPGVRCWRLSLDYSLTAFKGNFGDFQAVVKSVKWWSWGKILRLRRAELSWTPPERQAFFHTVGRVLMWVDRDEVEEAAKFSFSSRSAGCSGVFFSPCPPFLSLCLVSYGQRWTELLACIPQNVASSKTMQIQNKTRPNCTSGSTKVSYIASPKKQEERNIHILLFLGSCLHFFYSFKAHSFLKHVLLWYKTRYKNG